MSDVRGFTLIETMVALLVIAVALLALGGLLVQGMRTNEQSEERMDAAAVSQAILSDYEARILSGNPPAAGTPVTGTRDGFNYTLTATNNGSQWVLHITLVPVSGGRLNRFENQLIVSTVQSLGSNDARMAGGRIC